MGTEKSSTVRIVNEPATSGECSLTDPNNSNGDDEVRKNDQALHTTNEIPYLYRQDVVRGQNGMVGIVTEVAGDSDSQGSITDDDDEDDEDVNYGGGEANGGGENDGDIGEEGDVRNKNGGDLTPLPADQARILWMDQTESTRNINELTVIDRGFLHGDYVAGSTDPTGQVGIVVDVNMFVDLLTHENTIIKDVSSRELTRVREFTVGDYVVLGPWLGRIDDVLDNVTVLFDDGSVCKVLRAEPLRLKPLSKSTLEDGHFPYYPGQRVRASSSSIFKNSRWLSGLWKANRLEGTVTKVTVGSVFIYWIASAGYGPDSSTTPAEEQSPKNLKPLCCFSHANWQLGDWCLYSSPATSSSPLDKDLSKLELQDSINGDSTLIGGYDSEGSAPENSNEKNGSIDLDLAPESIKNGEDNATKDPVHETWPLHRKKIRKVVVKRDKKLRKKDESFERAVVIINTRTSVDVAWQDGSVERSLSSIKLIPIDSPGDHEFVAEQYVVEKASDDIEDANEIRRVGVVKSVNSKEKTACVRWLNPVSRPEEPREFAKEEIVSVYELEGHPDYDYCHGDVVVRLSPVSISSESAPSIEFNEGLKNQMYEEREELKQSLQQKKVENGSSENTSIEFSDLSWVGNISGLKDGDIEVTWADGMVSTVGPQAIYVVGRDDDDDSLSAGSEVSDDAASWETVDDDAMNGTENIKEEDGLANIDMYSEAEEERDSNNSSRNPALAVPLAAFRFVTRLASGIFSRGPKNSSSDFKSENEIQVHHEDESETSEGKDYGSDCTPPSTNVLDTCNVETDSNTAEVLAAAETLCDLRNEESKTFKCEEEVDNGSFKRFDIAKDPLDHYFIGSDALTNGRRWFKKVQQDWGILQNNLPGDIYVRVYEDRMDLLRAVIVGPYGTPYQDGLFFFDFYLPPEYPDVPPSAYYHSGGWRINPNLYEEGKVCLSLLNTWTGRGNEVWDPKSSSILQVLVSLQGLVLNSKPYFNEAGYDKQVGTAEGEKNSLSYNENTFLLNCKSMMYLMRKLPKDFEELVKEHFRDRGYFILKACDAYMKGSLIGSLTKDASQTDKSDTNSTSIGFKLMLAKIVPKLLIALSEIGADCEEFQHLLHPQC